ncbi:MAG: hypothetical protein LBQ31_06900 [Bacteroidales bacterium]|jgi:hypothetical protein|nr:hypothetical protein [Bacteroidales bacterium]
MAVKYIVVPHGNPGNPEVPKKFYAQAKGDACNAELRKDEVKNIWFFQK